jgi:hypothetical protein
MEEEEKKMTKEEIVAWYKDAIEMAKLRADLAEQQSRAVQYESARLQHAMMIAQITTGKNEELKEEEDEITRESSIG